MGAVAVQLVVQLGAKAYGVLEAEVSSATVWECDDSQATGQAAEGVAPPTRPTDAREQAARGQVVRGRAGAQAACSRSGGVGEAQGCLAFAQAGEEAPRVQSGR